MRLVFALVVSSILVACAGDGSTQIGTLVVDEGDGSIVGGTLESRRGPIAFRGETRGGVHDLEIEIEGLVIAVLADVKAGVFEFDGYAAADGSETQMLDDDRAALIELRDALDAYGPVPGSTLEMIRRFADTWAEFPSTLALRFERIAPPDPQVVYSICWAVNSYQSATHDCNQGDFWQDHTTTDYAWVSMDGAGPCGDGTWFWNGQTWSCYEPNHDRNAEYAYGNCFGRCGAGCGGGTQFTWDCLDHDQCVRTGHSTASWWCDDQFVSASDDMLGAPNCL
jgi:hypothetical protein